MLTSKAKGIENLKEKLIDLRNAKTMADEKMKTSDDTTSSTMQILKFCEALEVVSLILKTIEDKFSWHLIQDRLCSVLLEQLRFPVNMCIVLEWVSGA